MPELFAPQVNHGLLSKASPPPPPAPPNHNAHADSNMKIQIYPYRSHSLLQCDPLLTGH